MRRSDVRFFIPNAARHAVYRTFGLAGHLRVRAGIGRCPKRFPQLAVFCRLRPVICPDPFLASSTVTGRVSPLALN
eukprot:1181369-Pyramimonas_sp.AAC.1